MGIRLFVRAVAAAVAVPALVIALVTPGRPAAMPEIKIGTVLPLTGAFGSSGGYFKQGYTMAIDDVNKAGGLQVGGQKYHVTLIILDDGSDGTRSRSLVEKLVTDQHVNFLLGGYDTSLVEAQEVVPDQYKIPYVEGGGAASEIFKRGYKYIFGTLATVYDLGKITMEFVAAQQAAGKLPKPLTMAVVWENTDHGKDYIDAVTDAAKAHPDLYRVVLNQSFQLNGSDFSPLLQQVKASNAQAFLSDAHLPDFITMHRQYLQAGLYHQFVSYGARGPDQKGRQALGSGADYLIAGLWWTPALKDPASQLFTERYTKEYKAVPDWFQALSFETARALLAGISNAGTLSGPKVRDALANLRLASMLPGGVIKFQPNGQVATPYVMVQNTPGNTVRIIWPSNMPETRAATLPMPRP
ncbi:MAG TPA: amino acid ABC transporter substrate-binding protein [bacterium]|nr:amino acid ABC transporter substrate-binding protein [bacterium]